MDRLAGVPALDAGFPPPRFFTILLIACVLLLRIPGILYPHQWDPDESQMLSQGMKLLQDPVPWRSVDTTSSGPLNSYLISLLLWVGIKPGYLMIHWVAAVLGSLHTLLIYVTLLRLSSRATAACIALTVALFYGLAYLTDFLHYSSELLPVLLLGCGFYALVHWFERPGRFTIFCSGIAIGASIWCKFQAIPVAGALSVAIVWIVFRSDVLSWGTARRAHASAYVAGALLPAVLVLAPVAQAGAFKDFWYSYVLANLGYAGHESWLTTIQDAGGWFLMTPLQPLLWIWVAAVLARLWGLRRGNPSIPSRDRSLLAVLAIYTAAAFLAISRPATLFPHYANFLLFPVACFAGITVANATPRNGRIWLAVSALLVIAPVWSQARIYGQFAGAMRTSRRQPIADFNDRIAEVIGQIRRSRPVNSLAIWGWTPGVYVLTGIPPATRDAIGHFVISEGPMQAYFRGRFLNDLRRAMPDVFIDAVVPGAFLWYWTGDEGYETDPELQRFVDRYYVPATELELKPGARRVRFFVRKQFTTQ